MLEVKIDHREPLPLFEQVCAEIRRAIADGEIGPGERLPPARDLAAVLGVNSNTVLRALRLLRDEGLLEFRRGRGVTVVGSAHRSAVLDRARDLVAFAKHQGYDRDELIKIIQALGSAGSWALTEYVHVRALPGHRSIGLHRRAAGPRATRRGLQRALPGARPREARRAPLVR